MGDVFSFDEGKINEMKQDMRVSVICVYNKTNVFENLLKKSLKRQFLQAELIAVDNTKRRYSSAAKALNYGASVATGNVLVFVHQDVSFETPDALAEIVRIFCSNSGEGDIGGIVGAAFDENGNKCIVAGSKVNFLGEPEGEKGFADDFRYAETIDELLIIMTAETYKLHPFDNKTCRGWHYYAVEQCLNARKNKKKVLAINAGIKHLSTGVFDDKFYWAEYRVARKYKSMDRIIGTCCDFKPRPLFEHLHRAIIWTLSRKKKDIEYKLVNLIRSE